MCFLFLKITFANADKSIVICNYRRTLYKSFLVQVFLFYVVIFEG